MQSLLTAINSVASIGIIFSSARMLIGATSAVYLLSKGITASEIGIMKSFQALLLMLLDFPLGVLADRKGRRICLILGGLAGASWLALTAATSTFWMLLIAEGLNALSLAAFNGAFDALLAEKYISERGRPALNRLLGDYHAVLFAMMAFFSLAGGTFVSPESSFFWWVASGTLLAITALIPLLISDDSDLRNQRNEAASVAVKPSLLKLIQEDFTLVLKKVWTDPEVRKLAMPFIIIGVFYQLIIPYWQLFFTNSNHDVFMISGFKMSLFGPIFFGIILIQSLASKALGIPSVANASQRSLLTGVAVSVVLLTFAGYFRAQLWLCLAATLGVFALVRLQILSASAQLHNLIEDSCRASVLSALSFLTRVILIVVLPVSGFMIEHFGIWSLPLLGALLTIFCLAAGSFAKALNLYLRNLSSIVIKEKP